MLANYDPGLAVIEGLYSYVHAFLPRSPEIEFGAITPKGDYVTINMAGVAVDRPAMQRFLALPEVCAVLPALRGPAFDFDRLPVLKGRFPRSLANHYYGDRYVMVGDAAGLVRAFKGKGVTSAVQTGIRAAETMLQRGISSGAFADSYEKANRDITGDAFYGSAVRLLVTLSARFGLIDPVVRAAKHDADVRRGLFGAVSAHEPYRRILEEMLHYHAVLAVTRAMLPATRS
jgi:flavin-dependent dehydrogenase